MTKQRKRFGCGTSRRHKKLRNHWCQTSTTAEPALLLKARK